MKILYLPNEYSQQRQHEKKANIYPVRMAMECEWYRQQKGIYEVFWGDVPYEKIGCEGVNVITKPEGIPFLSLRKPDRIFTQAKSYTSGNYKYLPGTHIQSADGCWYGKCSFCVENKKKYVVRPVESVIYEINECKHLGFKEIFDDSGTFPIGSWLDEFCRKMKGKPIPISCNMRAVDIDYKAMKNAGFRMLLFGIESANQRTLDKIHKGVTLEDIKKYVKKASDVGLEPHIACMFGYPWETDEEAKNTLKLVHWLLRKGYAKTAQASFYNIPKSEERELTVFGGNGHQYEYVSKIYNVKYSPEFWFNQLKDIKNVDDIKYLWRKIKVGLNA